MAQPHYLWNHVQNVAVWCGEMVHNVEHDVMSHMQDVVHITAA